MQCNRTYEYLLLRDTHFSVYSVVLQGFLHRDKLFFASLARDCAEIVERFLLEIPVELTENLYFCKENISLSKRCALFEKEIKNIEKHLSIVR